MMAIARPLPPIPNPDVPLVDATTGRMTREWYAWLKRVLDQLDKDA